MMPIAYRPIPRTTALGESTRSKMKRMAETSGVNRPAPKRIAASMIPPGAPRRPKGAAADKAKKTVSPAMATCRAHTLPWRSLTRPQMMFPNMMAANWVVVMTPFQNGMSESAMPISAR